MVFFIHTELRCTVNHTSKFILFEESADHSIYLSMLVQPQILCVWNEVCNRKWIEQMDLNRDLIDTFKNLILESSCRNRPKLLDHYKDSNPTDIRKIQRQSNFTLHWPAQRKPCLPSILFLSYRFCLILVQYVHTWITSPDFKPLTFNLFIVKHNLLPVNTKIILITIVLVLIHN